jgi:hypothetical protein
MTTTDILAALNGHIMAIIKSSGNALLEEAMVETVISE